MIGALALGFLLGADGGADDAGVVVVLDDFDGVALQRAHLDHLLEIVLEHVACRRSAR